MQFELLLQYFWCNLKDLVLSCIPDRFRSKKDISGQTVLITGGASGFGRIFALTFAQLGCKVVVCDVNSKGNQETCQIVREAGGQATGYTCDVSNRQATYDLARKIKDEIGEVDILVNNAGIAVGERFLDIQDQMLEKVIGVNLLAHFWTTKAFLPDMMKKNKGHLVYVSSMAGIIGGLRMTEYAAGKYGVLGFAESLQMELFAENYNGINVTVSCPYFSRTGFFECSYNGLIAMPTPERVVSDVVNGVLTNKYFVFSPNTMRILSFLKEVSASKSVIFLMKLIIGEKLIETCKVKKVDFTQKE